MSAPYIYQARAVRVVDGDTVDLDIDLGFHLHITRQRVRLLGLDTPERGQAGWAEATEALKSLLHDAAGAPRPLLVHTVKGDSFGRWLATIYRVDRPDDETSVNEMMRDMGWDAYTA